MGLNIYYPKFGFFSKFGNILKLVAYFSYVNVITDNHYFPLLNVFSFSVLTNTNILLLN